MGIFDKLFKKRVPGVYSPNAPRKEINFISIAAILISSIIGLWIVSYLFGNFLGLSSIGPVLMIILFTVIVILALVVVKRKMDGTEASNKDFALIIILVALLVLGYLYLPQLAPELYAQSIASIKQNGLNAFIKP